MCCGSRVWDATREEREKKVVVVVGSSILTRWDGKWGENKAL